MTAGQRARDGSTSVHLSTWTVASGTRNWRIGDASTRTFTPALPTEAGVLVTIAGVELEYLPEGTGVVWFCVRTRSSTALADAGAVSEVPDAVRYRGTMVETVRWPVSFNTAGGERRFSRHWSTALRGADPEMEVWAASGGANGLVRLRITLLSRRRFAS